MPPRGHPFLKPLWNGSASQLRVKVRSDDEKVDVAYILEQFLLIGWMASVVHLNPAWIGVPNTRVRYFAVGWCIAEVANQYCVDNDGSRKIIKDAIDRITATIQHVKSKFKDIKLPPVSSFMLPADHPQLKVSMDNWISKRRRDNSGVLWQDVHKAFFDSRNIPFGIEDFQSHYIPAHIRVSRTYMELATARERSCIAGLSYLISTFGRPDQQEYIFTASSAV